MANATQEDLGTIAGEPNQRIVRLERQLDAIPAEVWSALTEPDQMERWMGPSTIDAREGGAFTVDPGGGGPVQGTIRVCVEEKVIEFDWSGPGRGTTRFELEAAEGGTKLTLTHSDLQDEDLPAVAAGWFAGLEALSRAIAGDESTADERRATWTAIDEKMHPAYQDKLAALAAGDE